MDLSELLEARHGRPTEDQAARKIATFAVIPAAIVGLLAGTQLVGVAGRSHHKSFSDKHFEEVVVVPACGEAFVFDPDLVGCFVLEHDQSGLS